MLRAGSLFYALAISVIIALLSSSLLLAAHFSRLSLQQDTAAEEVIRNANSGLQLLMSAEYNASREVNETDLFGRGMDSVQLGLKSWGAFEIALVRAHRNRFSHELIASVGWQPDANDQTALTLADLDRPLSVTGKTELRGDCYLPKSGIKRAYIEGESYSGSQLVYGLQKNADRFLPKYNDTLVKRIERLFDFVPGANDSVLPLDLFMTTDSICNSFRNRPLYIFSNGALSIRSKNISGQVCIISRRSVQVEKNSILKDVLIIAPQIQIADEVQGQFQAFARDSLETGTDLLLHYPSVLGLIATEKSPARALLLLGENSLVMGQVFACSLANDFKKQVIVQLEKESAVYGSIYSGGLVDLKGTVTGDVTCSKFELRTASAVYENHLMNAVINRPRRSAAFVASAITRKKSDHKAVAAWLE